MEWIAGLGCCRGRGVRLWYVCVVDGCCGGVKEVADGGRNLLRVVREDAPHDGDERGNCYGKVVKHISGEQRGRMSGEALFFATELRLPRTPQFFLAFLFCDESMN